MNKFRVLLAVVTLTIGVAQASTLYVNTFDLGQLAPAGGIGATAPAVATAFHGTDTLDALGITFDFTEGPSASPAIYGDTLGTVSNVLSPLSDPVLDGPADGILTLNFDQPTDFLSFNILFGIEPGNSGGLVTIGATPLSFTTTGGQGSGGFFSIGSFSSGTLTPFSQAVITFDDPMTQFAIDNLSYDAISAVSATPEPGSLALLAAGALLFGALVRFRRSALCVSDRA
jgi:PEP-CTERM motif